MGKSSSRQVASSQTQCEGRGLGIFLVDDPRARKYVKDSKTAAYRPPTATCRIPCEADPRLEVAQRRIGLPGVRRVHRGAEQILQDVEWNVRLRGVGFHFISKAEVKRQVPAEAPIVLHVTTDDGEPGGNFSFEPWIADRETRRLVGKKRLQTLEIKGS